MHYGIQTPMQSQKLMAYHRLASQSLLIEFSSLKIPIPTIFSQLSRSLPSSINPSSNDKEKAKPRILYIDDETRITRIIKYGLEQYGFIVDVYNHPKSVMSSFEPGIYDLLLIDVRLPEINGLDLCNELLKIDDKVKVCFITAYELQEEEVREKVSGLQTECIIKKPVSFDTLVSKINRQLHRNN